MKLLVVTAIIAAVASSPITESNKWPWQVGKEYRYNVDSLTWTKFDQSKSNGNAFKAQFLVRVLEPGRLVAKLENPLYAQVQGEVSRWAWPSDLNYSPVKDIEHPFEIFVDEGRVTSLKVPTTLTVSYENLLKGLVSAIQVDLTERRISHDFPNSYDKESFQGLFMKMETDVTGDCETLYSVSPMAAEWHRELPEFAEDPIEITKSKNYDTCVGNVDYHFGVPEGAIWKGLAYNGDEKQFIKHTSESHMLVGKQGPIYKSETISSVYVNPLIFGKQKAEVYSYVSFLLSSVQPESSDDWKKTVEYRTVESLLFKFDEAAFTKGEKNIANAQKLLQDMTPLLQDPNNLPKADFLSKFNLLVRSIVFMNSEQLTQMTSSIEVAKTSKNSAKNNMWIIYRDAVAQAGTVAAFHEIKNWILTKKIVDDDAADIISSMASVLRSEGTKKGIVNEFFEFVMKPEVQEQKILNTTALLAFTKFISFNNDINDFVFIKTRVLPRLSQELAQAIENGDKNKAQVYVRVIGNIAYPSILKVFAPYLEGKISVSKYLRIQMVLSLKTLANKKDESVRAVLFSLLKNTAEPYEVRVAAALNIFMAYPTQDMMQIMAHMSNDDPSTQVRAVLTNSIIFAAGLKDPRFEVLAKTAKSVLFLVSKEKFGYRYSTDSLIDDYTSDDDIAHFREVSFIGSENSVLPVYQRGALRMRGTGWTEEDWFTLSISDVSHFMDYITGAYLQRPQKTEQDYKFTAKKIAELLDIKSEHRCDLEGSFFIDTWNQQTLLTFTEEDLTALLKDYVKEMEKLLGEESYNYTKVLSQKQVFVSFPLAMGVPFIFDYSEPTAIILQSQFKTSFSKEMSSNTDLKLTYSRNLDGSVGFIDTLGDVYASSGIINKLQFYIPLSVDVGSTYPELQFTFKFKFPEENANLIHLSVWPYTTLQNTDSLLTVSENKLTKFIERPYKVVAADVKLGQLLGTVFHLQGYSYSADFENIKSTFDVDILSSVRNLLYQKDVAQTQFNLKYLAKESEIKDVTYNVFYDTVYKLEDESEETIEEMEPASAMNDVTPGSEARRKEIIKRVQAGIRSPTVRLIDISAAFDGKKKTEYVFTGAFANSYVDHKTQAAIFFNGQQQFNAIFKMTKPNTTPINFEEAIKNEFKVLYEADFKYGNADNVHLSGFSERSKLYTEKLLNDPLGKQCMEETSKKNLYQKDCHKMIIKAHAPDYLKAKVTSKNLSGADLKTTFDIYESYKEYYNWEAQEDLFKTSDNDTLEIEAHAWYYENNIDYAFTTKYGVLRLNNVETLPYYPYALAIYAPITSWERSRNWFTDYQHLPFCTVDDNKIWTFSGRSYDYSLTGAWHVVMVDEAQHFGNDLVILMRRPSEKQAEVYVSYTSVTGKGFEMQLTPKTIEVTTNITSISDNGLTTYFDDVLKTPLLQYYTIAEDTEFYSINDGAVRLMFDTHRLVIFTDDHRSTTRGICGQSTTQTSDDYITPYGLVSLPEHYGASFSLDSQEKDYSDAKTAELKKEAKLKAYQPVTKYTNILRNSEWNEPGHHGHVYPHYHHPHHSHHHVEPSHHHFEPSHHHDEPSHHHDEPSRHHDEPSHHHDEPSHHHGEPSHHHEHHSHENRT